MTNYSILSKNQLISQLMKLQNDYKELSTQSGQVEALMQQQIEQKDNIIRQKDTIINSLSSQLSNTQDIQEQVISLETENDLLESTIRMLQSKLNVQSELYNEALEKIAFLENEIDLLKQTITSVEKINETWLSEEKKWNETFQKLQEKLETINKEHETQLEKINTAKIQESLNTESKYYDLLERLKVSESNNQQLSQKLEKISRKYKKLVKIANFIKIKQHGLVKAYTTPALKPVM